MPKLHLIYTLTLILTLSNANASEIEQAQTPSWKLEIDDKESNVSVFYRTLDSANIEFKGVTYIKTSLNSLVALLSDAEAMPSWVHNVERARMLTRINDVEVFAYVVNKTPFPFSYRDSIIHTKIYQNPETLAVTVDGKSAPHYIPESPDYVRLSVVKSFWKFIPLENGIVKVVFQGLGEPGGNISPDISRSTVFQWITSKLLWELPMLSMKNMKREVLKEKYQTQKFSYIIEPKS